MISLGRITDIVPITDMDDLDVLWRGPLHPVHELGEGAHRGILSEEPYSFPVTDMQLVREWIMWPDRVHEVALEAFGQEHGSRPRASIDHEISVTRRVGARTSLNAMARR
jgi:hypothetical protein